MLLCIIPVLRDVKFGLLRIEVPHNLKGFGLFIQNEQSELSYFSNKIMEKKYISKEINERPNHSLALKGRSAKQGRCTL
jgi:hypothetical protein